jgi:hypothetical protein
LGDRARPSLVAIGCVLLAAGVAAALTRDVPVRTGTNEMLATTALGGTVGRLEVCQDAELIPAGTGAVRVWLRTTGRPGPALALETTSGGATVARGTLAPGWSGEAATIPLRPVTREQRPARICVTIGATSSVALMGQALTGEASAAPNAGPPATASGTQLGGRLRLEYLMPGRHSWWSQVGTIARRMGFGRRPGGSGVAFAAALLMLAAAGVALRQLVRSER